MRDRKEEAAILAEDILENIEFQSISLSAVMLKCARLARLLDDHQTRQIFQYEASGYPTEAGGIPTEVFEAGRKAGRVTSMLINGRLEEKLNHASVEQTENAISSLQSALSAAKDPDISISSANPSQIIWPPKGNSEERNNRTLGILNHSKILAQSRAFAYEYATNVQFELEFSGAANEIFDQARNRIDSQILAHIGQGIQKTESISKNIESDDPEDWANAAHSCRRLLQEIADSIFPAQDDLEKNGKLIKLGAGNYINRLIAFIESKSDSPRFHTLVGSTLAFVGERLDAIFSATQKGSHAKIETRAEAERYVIYTFLTVGDILSLSLKNDVHEMEIR